MNKILAFLTFLALAATACEDDEFRISYVKQPVLFQVEYVNYAWGYSHSGIIIDSAGNVRHFNLPETWHSPDSTGYLSEHDMNQNLAQAGEPLIMVGKDTLMHYFRKLDGAASGKLSDPYSRMFDAGETVYSGFFYSPLERKYRMILVKRQGDWCVDNYSREADEIYRWLTSVFGQAMDRLRN